MKVPHPLVITGQTGTGKTSLAIELAHILNGELVSADSRQVYTDLNIGTGKYDDPHDLQRKDSRWYLKGVPIYGINCVSATESWSAGDFAKYSLQAIAGIKSRGGIPIIVGGTGFYIKSLIDPDQTLFIPQNESLRNYFIQLEKEYGTRSEIVISKLQSQLAQIDEAKLSGMNNSDRNNVRRLMRAIEVAEWRNDNTHDSTKSIIKTKIDAKVIGLYAPKEILEKKITDRVEDMMRNGYQSEVEMVAAQFDWDTPVLQTIGYKEWQPYFEKKISLAELKISIVQSHLRYARKQMIYLRRLANMQWFDISVESWHKAAIEYCLADH